MFFLKELTFRTFLTDDLELSFNEGSVVNARLGQERVTMNGDDDCR